MTKNILILGATGHLGKVLTKTLLSKNYTVTALVRNPNKFDQSFSKVKIIKGNVLDENDLKKSLENIDAVVSVLGHGFRTKFPIQEKALSILIPLMEGKKIKRFVTVTGEALIVQSDKRSFLADIISKLLTVIDPYRMNDAKRQQQLIENSTLEWTVLRTPIHVNKEGGNHVCHVGLDHLPIWKTVSRDAVCEFISECIEKNSWIKQSPIIYET